MIDDDDVEDDFIETLGLDDFLSTSDYGRDRGRTPELTESQKRAVEYIVNKIYLKSGASGAKKKTDDDGEEILAFDIMDAPRVLLHQGKAMKKSIYSYITQSRQRILILFNDVLLITSSHASSTTKLLNFSEKYAIHQVIYLDTISFTPRPDSEPNNPLSFEIFAPERSYIFYVENESEKKIWMEELTKTVMALHCSPNGHLSSHRNSNPGWQHEIVRGTIFSDALLGRHEAVTYHLNHTDMSADVMDSCGMTPLHWASLRGHVEVVRVLLETGAEVDILNNGLNSPLLLAGAKGHDAVLRLLLDQCSDVRVRNLKDRDVLFMGVLYASQTKGLTNILHMLNYKGVHFDQQDSTGASPLHECAIRNLHRSVHLLVDAGAQVNTKHGRNGMTPLQLACSLLKPDVETVRSFLESGAHPNWKDGSGRSAFTIILDTQMNSKYANRNKDGQELTPEQQAKAETDAVHQWVLYAMGAIMELVRCGGRYTADSIANLRPSFQDAIESARVCWNNATAPENFETFVAARSIAVSKKNWMSDGESDHCLLCVEKFTFGNRKHHCRACGILCCLMCSSKRLPLHHSATSTSSSSQKPKSSSDNRVCDGCFNSLCAQATARNIALAKAKKTLETLVEEQPDNAMTTPSSSAATETADARVNTMSPSLGVRDVADINSTLSQIAVNLDERGEKLEQLAEKTERMENAAAQFSDMAKQLNAQQKAKASPWRKSKNKSSNNLPDTT